MSSGAGSLPPKDGANGANDANGTNDNASKKKKQHGTRPSEKGSDPQYDIHERLKELRIKELSELSTNPTNIRSAKAAEHYLYRVALETSRYIRYVFWTWWGFSATVLVGGLGPFDCFSMFVYAFGGTIVLFVVLVGCFILNSPPFTALYWWYSNKFGGNLGLVNNANPNLFMSLTQDQVDAAKEYLSKGFDAKKNTETERRFNLDAAKLLLQFAAIVYEHPNQAVRAAVNAAAGEGNEDKKESKVRKTVSEYDSGRRGDDFIRHFATGFGLDYEPLSELGNTSSACAALFWDPDSDWIALTFKGTQPIEFGEWLSDLNAKMSHVGAHIPGFRKVHLGFKERVFPQNWRDSGSIRPYDTISTGVQLLAEYLRERNNKPRINVWVTGHSLGCATASLVYTRFLMREKEISKHSVLRDAYLFAAPILSDRESVEVFNAKMLEDPEKPRTMWRITSNGDFVATCLPDLGDYNSITVSSNNGFAFAHLGTEVRMSFGRSYARASGNHLPRGTLITTESKFKQEDYDAWRDKNRKMGGFKEWFRKVRGVCYQRMPMVGRFVAHGTVFYWDQLDFLDPDTRCRWR